MSNSIRGLVCTTYIAAVWGGMPATADNAMIWSGSKIASCSGAPFHCGEVPLAHRPLAEVKKFLQQHQNETFLVGSHNHIVLVVRGVVHDFTNSPRKGYNHHSVDNWHPKDHLWTVGKPKLQF